MWSFITVIGFLGLIVFLIIAIISLVKRNGTAKKKFIFAGVSFIVLIVGAANTPSSGHGNSSGSSETASASASAPATTQVDAAAQKKADEEANKKADAEAKQKAAEETKQKALAEKSKNADYAKSVLPTLSDGLALQDKTYNFIVANSDIFPAKNQAQIQKANNMINPNIKFGHLEKNIDPYLDKVIAFDGTVVDAQEQKNENGDTVALIQASDDEFNQYRALFIKSTGDIIKGDRVKIIGVPAGNEAFSNVSGGTTKAVFLIGSDIHKIQQ